MNSTITNIISIKLNIPEQSVINTVVLLEEGATIPFISRYRKELTGSLDEVQVSSIQKEMLSLKELIKRKETILQTIKEAGALTEDLRAQIEETFDSNTLEDIYLPYKPKKRTRATLAKENGLEGLAKILMSQLNPNFETKAKQFVNDKVESVDVALAGARDIIAEWISENPRARDMVRYQFNRTANLVAKVVKGKETEGDKYRSYFDWSESLNRIPSHRFLAIQRGAHEGILRMKLAIEEEAVVRRLSRFFIKPESVCSDQIKLAVKDAAKRLLFPSIETEFLKTAKEKADEEAVTVFVENLSQLLLAPPLGEKRVMAIDPGFRTGCKVVCLSAEGALLHNETIFPHPPQREAKEASRKILSLVNAYKIEAIAVGNGTAGRETERFIKYIQFDHNIEVFSVNEDGASIYSASKTGRDEFPNFDVTVRGAVSIGRRLMDPLAELVKIDPKSIGVGQYQHDVEQKKLNESLTEVVEFCVNKVGVNVNTASKHLLSYISGLGPQLADNIVKYRSKSGPFKSRNELMEVPRMGAKSFEQCAGFLRVISAENPLDNSAVHPESYSLVKQMASDLNCSVNDLIGNDEKVDQIPIDRYVNSKIGIPTLKDIVKELAKPGLDPREDLEVFEFSEDVRKIDDLQMGMELNGIVTNITRFGAFVDIGIKENGLIHVSQMADEYISDPAKVVHLNQHLRVKVKEVDQIRKRIQLTLKGVKQ